MIKGKQLIFNKGFLVNSEAKVYPQEISSIYRYKPNQLNRKTSDLLNVEGRV